MVTKAGRPAVPLEWRQAPNVPYSTDSFQEGPVHQQNGGKVLQVDRECGTLGHKELPGVMGRSHVGLWGRGEVTCQGCPLGQ